MGFSRVLAASLLAVAIPLGALAVEYPPRPEEGTFVRDGADLLSTLEDATVAGIAARLWEEEQIPLAVATIPSLVAQDAAGHTIERYATELFDTWGVGSPERNFGILLLVSPGDRRARIELGAGWEHRYDRDAETIMNDLVVPRFREGNYGEGILAGVRGLDAMARGLALPKPEAPWWALPLFLLGIAGVVGVIVSLFKSGRSGWGWALILALGAFLFFLLRNSGSGGGGFGGGSSGGGGATGSW